MNGQEYLNQISADSRPVKKSKMANILSSKYFLIGGGIVIALIIIMIIGSILSGNKGGEKNDSYRLYLHLTNTTDLIGTYQNDVKSSKLRADSASLNSVLSIALKELTDYLTAKYGFKEKNIDKDFVEEATTAKDELDSELFEAKINGVLDRVYAHKMAYEISTIKVEEAKLIKETKSDELKKVLDESYKSLDTLLANFSDFSETK